MSTVQCTLGQLAGLINRDMKRIVRNTNKAAMETAERGERIAKNVVPVAFGELRDSIQHFGPQGDNVVAMISASAPHAADVEIGSEPHTPDLEALIRWVKLRGMQGLMTKRQLSTQKMGLGTFDQARGIKAMLQAEIQGGTRGSKSGRARGSYTPLDAAERVANRIALGIQKHGTKPHWYMRNTVAVLDQPLDKNIRNGLER